MKTVWIAAGFAAGYVLGTKAGRERYEQIAQAAQDLANKPAVVDAQAKVKQLAERGREAVMAKVGGDDSAHVVTSREHATVAP
jgi:hypothetical protein